MIDLVGFLLWHLSLAVLMDGWIDGLGRCPRVNVGMRVSSETLFLVL